MKKLILVAGPAGIGKSTYCRDYVSKHNEEDVHIVSSDETRRAMCGGYDKFPPHHDMSPIYQAMVKEAKSIAQGKEDVTVMIDMTLLYNERRMFFYHNLAESFDSFQLIMLKVHDYRLCLERNHKRIQEKWVPAETVLDMASHYEEPDEEVKSHFSPISEVYVD